ncbi:MAG: GNAT family N-acetyltransferase [Defluviitaleaceae bacterium]|nr:GNAT family N-acetyltransferase [Defluviitaleaceae bacterium]
MIKEAYEIIKIDVDCLKVEELKQLYSIDGAIVVKYNFLKRFRDVNEYRNLYLTTFVENENELFVIKNNSSICGTLSFIKFSDWNGKEQYKLTIYLCDSKIDKLLISCLNQFIDEKLLQYNQFAIIIYNNELEEMIKGRPHKVNLKANIYTLKKENIDIDLLNKSIDEYQTKNSDLYIKYTDIISEEYIEQYCELFTETMKDMADEKEDGYERFIITPEIQRQRNELRIKRGFAHHCYMVFNENNEMIAKTNVSVNEADQRFPYQFMVGVDRRYRGRSLGKWLYAAMYKKLFENLDFEKAYVAHHPENKHIIDISEWIGYKFSYLETTYLVN